MFVYPHILRCKISAFFSYMQDFTRIFPRKVKRCKSNDKKSAPKDAKKIDFYHKNKLFKVFFRNKFALFKVFLYLCTRKIFNNL